MIWNNGSADGLWSTGINWNTNAVPTGTDDVQLPLGLGLTITLSAGELANTLLFQDNYTLSGGNLTLTNGSITVDPTFSDTISSVLNGTVITKLGTGSLVLSGANGYTGLTTVSAGVLNIQNATALGTTAGATSVTSGAALEMQGAITVTGEALTLNGTGVASGGALRNISGANSFNGNITLGSDTRVNSDAGTLTITPAAGNAFAGAFNLTLGGAGNITITKPIATGTGNVTKDGAGTLILSGVNTYTGTTTVSGGVLSARSASALGTSAAGTSVASGAALEIQGTITIVDEALTLNGTGIGGAGALRNTLNNNSFNGNITLGSDTRVNSDSGTLTINPATGDSITGAFNLTLGGAGNITVSKAITTGTGTLSKDGAGTVILLGADTYTGATTVSTGVLNIQNNTALGTNAAGTSVTSGAALQMQNNITVTGEALTLNGTGVGVTGALRNISGNNNFNGNITLGSDTRINSDSGTLTINPATGDSITGAFNLTLGGVGSTVISQAITTGAGTLTKDGTGTATLLGADTYTGATTVSTGVLNIRNNTSLGTNAAGTSVTSGAALQIQNSITVTGETLTLNGTGIGVTGALRSISGTNSFNGNITLGSDTRINSDSGTLTINPATGDSITGAFNLTLGGVGSTVISQAITTGVGTLTKDGTGTATLLGADTYTGATTVSVGVLNIQNATGLGTTASGTTVSSGAALQVQGGITVGAEALTLNGGGVASNGALRNISGNNSFAGAITLASASTIDSDAGTLTLSGGITNGGFASTFSGAGSITENGLITGAGALLKNGSGTLALAAGNTYSGGTTINGGTIILAGLGALGSSGTISFGGGTLQCSSSNTTDYSSRFSSAINQTYSIDTNGQNVTLASALTSSGGSLTKLGAGTLTLLGVNTYSGATTVSGGTLQMSVINCLLNTGALTISGGTFDLQIFDQTIGSVTLGSGSITGTGAGILTGSSYTLQSGTVSAILAGTGAVTKNTSGTVTLSGANLYTGATTISAGTLQVNTDSALGTTLNGTTVANGAALKLNGVNYSTAEALALNGSGISNGGALTNTGTSTFAGAINIATNATISAGGGTLNLTGGIAKNGTTLTFAGGGTVNIMTNGITGSSPNSDLVVDGTTVVLDTANSYNGPTTVQNSGTLQLGANNVLPTSPQTAMTVNTSSVFDMASFSDGVASLAGDSTATVKNSVAGGTSTLTVNPASGSTTFDGVIAGTNSGAQGDIALLKTGAGTLVLTGTNTFSGSTTVSGGTLTAAGSSGSALGSTSSITVNSGGTLLLGASDQIKDTATMTLAGGTFSKENFSEGTAGSVGLGALTLTATGSHIDFGTGTVGVLSFASFSPGSNTLTIDNWTGIDHTVGSASTDRLIFNADQTSNLSFFSFTGYSGTTEFALGNGYFEVTPAPEPSTWIAAAFRIRRARLPSAPPLL